MALIDKASLLMVPSVYEDGKLYNVLPSGNKAPDKTGNHNGYDQTRADFTFSRDGSGASKATRITASGLIEKGRTNVLLQSNQFDTTWYNSGTALTSGQAGYDGSNDAWLASRGGGYNYVAQDITSSGVQSYSIYAKAGSFDWAYVRVQNSALAYRGAYFDLANGVVGTIDSGIVDTKIESAGNGYYRCTLVFNETLNRVLFYPVPSNGGVGVGGTGTILIQDAQLEKGLVATDYIETTTAAASAGLLGDMPRLDYSGGASSASLLLEPSRTNLITQSEYFGAWTASGLTITNNDTTSPEGVSNAAKLTLPSGSATKRIALGSMPVTATARSYSFFVKSDDITAVQLVHSGDLQGYARFDISSGVVGSKGSKTTSDIEDYGNGWYRCIANFDSTNAFGSTIYLYISDDASGGYGGTTSAQGDLFIYGAQYEESSYGTSYIPTHGTAVARAADDCSVTGVSDVIGQTEGTLYIEFDHRYMASYPNEYIIDIEDSTHKLWIRKESAGNTLTSRLIVSGSNVWTIGISATDGIAKIALAYKSGDSAVYYNGNQIGTSSATYSGSSFDDLYFNLVGSSNPELNAKNLTLFKERLTNSELATLTTL